MMYAYDFIPSFCTAGNLYLNNFVWVIYYRLATFKQIQVSKRLVAYYIAALLVLSPYGRPSD
jgi:hypothetical protein